MRNIPSNQTALNKHVPQRTCLACRKVKAKRELIRLVLTPDGSVEIDGKGKKAGRGAYLCRASECWETGLNRNRLEHTMRSSVKLDNREQLLEQLEELPKGD